VGKKDTVDKLDADALAIATKYLLGREERRIPLSELAERHNTTKSTLHRRLIKWKREGRFKLIDNLDTRTTVRALERDPVLEQMLVDGTKLFRAHVVRTSGAEAAYTKEYLEDPGTQRALNAYRAGDALHRALGEETASLLLERLRPDMTIGLASGRAVSFAVDRIRELVEGKSPWTRRDHRIRLVSLCGGARVGTWVIPTDRDLDADENVFVLAAALNVPQDCVSYMGDWISMDRDQREQEVQGYELDLALVGLGQLNTRHHFFRHSGRLQLGAVKKPLERIKDWQVKKPTLLHRVGEIGHRLFPVGGTKGLPEDFLEAIQEINGLTRAVPAETIGKAREIIMVAGGRQKARVLAELARGRWSGAPIDHRRLTLVTDAWTAEEILRTA
jgi:DNA-binding transcriptional regulator LsrR (DeoR family)